MRHDIYRSFSFRTLLLPVALLFGLCTAPAGAQQAASGQPLRIIVPFSAGATIDAVARLVASKLPYQTIVDNRAGAGGILGTSAVAKAKPDGHTIVLVANNLSTNSAVRSDLPYDPEKDFAPVSLVGYVPYAFVVPGDSKFTSLKELFGAATGSSNPINYGHIGVGSHGHFIGAMLEESAKVRLTQVPYKGQTEIMMAVMGGHLETGIVNLSIAVKQLKEKRTKILATLTEERTSFTPDVPTMKELGLPIVENAWYGFLAPAGTPPEIIETLNRDITASLRSPEVSAKMNDLGIQVIASSSQKFSEIIRDDLLKFRRIARAANIKAE
ncbi:MAG: Bug family tripartite tricarboxylate transporter substrate binding protein [Burkholderiaceae bacterium]